MGEGESEMTDRDFHSMKAVDKTSAKLRIWERDWRGFDRYGARDESMVAAGGLALSVRVTETLL